LPHIQNNHCARKASANKLAAYGSFACDRSQPSWYIPNSGSEAYFAKQDKFIWYAKAWKKVCCTVPRGCCVIVCKQSFEHSVVRFFSVRSSGDSGLQETWVRAQAGAEDPGARV
jgi:hypothetical protein